MINQVGSQVNSQLNFDENNWVVSLLNTGSAYAGHAMLVVEGMKDGKLFVGQYEVQAKCIVNESISDVVQKTLGNNQGYIYTIRVVESENYTRPQGYEKYSSKSWYAAPEAIQKMVDSIKADQSVLENAKANGEPLPFKYQTAGSYRAWIFGGNAGDSCLTWAEAKLQLIGITTKSSIWDFIKAVPELHVDSTNCTIS